MEGPELTTAYKKQLRDMWKATYGRANFTEIGDFYQEQTPFVLTEEDVYRLIEAEFLPPIAQAQPPIFVEQIDFFARRRYFFENINNLREMYNVIKQKIEEDGGAIVSLHFYDRLDPTKARVKSISIRKPIIKKSYEAFKEAIDNIKAAYFDEKGSDKQFLDIDYLALDLNTFDLGQTYIAPTPANGKSDKIIFKVMNIVGDLKGKDVNGKKYDYNNCSTKCLLACGYSPKQDVKRLSDLRNLIKEIKDNSLPINIIANSFTLKRSINNIVDSSPNKKFLQIRERGKMRDNLVAPISLETDIDLVYFYKTNLIAEHTIIYDELNKHADVIQDNKVELCDDVFLSTMSQVIKGDSVLFSPLQVNKNAKSQPTIKSVVKYVFFDYETVIDWKMSSCMSEYSLSILVLDNDELEKLKLADLNKNIDEVNEIRKNKCLTFMGYDCSKKFIDWILENEANTKFVFIGFNNTNFDNFIFLNALLKHQKEYIDRYIVQDIFYGGSQLINFQMNARHTTFDIRKHLTGSLKYNCESFKINCCSKKEFNHNTAQELHDNGELINWISTNEELKEYNEYDVLATACLYAKYREALMNIYATKEYAIDLYETKTIGSLIYKVFDAHAESNDYEFKKLSYPHYRDLRKYKVAGRVEMFNGVQKLQERMVSCDVCSLYPYVMAVKDVYYPVGDTTATTEYMGDDVIAFYYCDIDQSNLRGMNLPKIYPRKTDIENDWGHEEILEDYLISNVMVRLLRKYGCKVEIKTGFYWKNKVKSCEMFGFLLDFMSVKNHQDTLKQSKDEKYNPALRETLKLLMNSLSGKVIEGLHSEKTVSVGDVKEYIKIEGKAEKINTITTLGNKIFITYEVNEETLINKQKPVYLGVLIYDYAKEYMYEKSYSKIGLDKIIYTDTDATKFRHKDFAKWNEWIQQNNEIVPHHKEVEEIDPRYKNHLIYEADSKVFGSFEDELGEMTGENYMFYCLEKKSWCYSVDGEAKYRFKGLNDNAQILTGNEKFLIKKPDGSYRTKPNMEQEIHKFYINNKHNSIGENNQVKFFDKIYKEGEAFVLTSSFRKIVKNSNRSVEVGEEHRYNNLMNNIQVKYVVKRLSITSLRISKT